MATTDFPVNHPLAVKLWAKKLSYEVTGETYFSRFASEGTDSIFQVKTETQKGAGDKITHGLRMLATGAGIQGDSTAEGSEEALTFHNDSLFIDQLREPFRTGGRMTEQRVPFDLREECRMAAKDWWVERLDTSVFNQLTGNTAQSDTRYSGNNSTVAPSTAGSITRLVVGGGETAETSLSATTTHAIKLSDIDKAVAIAKVQSPRIRPITLMGKKYYVVFLHPYAIRQLRADASTAGNFFDVQKAQLQGGKISDNPILTGAEFIHNGAIVHESSYLPATVGASNNALYRRGALCGAQAVCCAYGQNGGPNKMTWVEEMFDYENQFGVSAGMIFGMKKSVFNSIDFGVITFAGYAPAP
jgi:N4-gp56 family major capsid protein